MKTLKMSDKASISPVYFYKPAALGVEHGSRAVTSRPTKMFDIFRGGRVKAATCAKRTEGCMNSSTHAD
jgi:hypothetical protein